ncbi:MAG: MG2 domain-containing protein [Elusimicrobiota bacterium]
MRYRFRALLYSALLLYGGALCLRTVHAGWLDSFTPFTPAGESEPRVISPGDNIQDPSGPRVLSVAPSGHVQDAGETLAVTVTFDRPMIALSALAEQKTEGLLSIDPPLPGKFRWLGTETLVFTPEKPFTLATRYTMTLHAGITAKDGARMQSDYRWTFETARPQFSQSDPYHGSQFIDLKVPILLAFNQPMSPQKAMDFLELVGRPTENLFGPIRAYAGTDYRESFRVSVRKPTEEEFKQRQWFAKDRNYCLVVEPQRPLKKEYTYSLILRAGLPAAEGFLGLIEDRHLQFKSYNHFRVLGIQGIVHPEEGLPITFSNPVQGKLLAETLSVDPSLQMPEHYARFTYYAHEHRIPFKFEVKQAYSVLIKRGLEDKFGQKLKNNWEGAFQVTSYAPYAAMPTGNLTVEAKLKHRLPVTAINMMTVGKLLYPVSAIEAIPRLQNQYVFHQNELFAPAGAVPEAWNIQGTLDKSAVLPLELDSSLNKDGHGFLFANLRAMDPNPAVEPHPLSVYNHGIRNRLYKAFVQVTNLGITAKCSPEDNLVWVTFLRTGKPVIGAAVELRDDKGDLLWQGKTDREGLAKSPGWAILKVGKHRGQQNPRVWIIAKWRSDSAMVASNWGTGIYPYSFMLPYVFQQIHPEYGGHVYSDRGLYRVGETAQLKGVLRQKRKSDWVIADVAEVEMTIENSRGEEVHKRVVAVSSFGSFHTDFRIPPTAVTGHYNVHVRDPRDPVKPESPQHGEALFDKNKLQFWGGFQVEAFMPAKFEVKTRLSRDSYIFGDEAEGTIRGWYLFGAPMKKAKFTWRARLWETLFAPKGHEGYAFGPRRHLMEYKGTAARTVLTASDQGELDEKGGARVSFPLKEGTLLGSLTARLEGTVTDEDRQSVSGSKTAIVHAGEFYLGIKPSASFLEARNPLDISVLTTDPDGKPVSGEKVRLQVIRREWHSVRKAGIKGRTSWLTEKKDIEVEKYSLESAAEPVTVRFKPDKPGYYIIHAEAKDGRSRRIYADAYFYVTGTDYVAWARSNDDKIDLVADRTRYKPGETAKVMVKSPYESALVLVSLEREGILRQFTTTLKGSADIVEIPLEERFVPNVYVSVVLLQGRTAQGEFDEKGDDVGKPSFKIGYVNLPVDPGTRRLKVEVASDKEEYRPRGKVSLDFLVQDPSGNGVESEFSVSVVDRGILDLISYQTPDSFDSFYGPRPLSVETVESRQHVVGQRNYGEKGENRGGDGRSVPPGLLADADLRGLFKASAFWKADLTTDEKGRAAVSFELPDNLTTFKVMVTAHTKKSKFGAGDTEFAVKKPLMLKPSLPRFARLGDRFQAGVVAHNHTGKGGEVTVEAGAEDIALHGEGRKKIVLGDGMAQEVVFDYAADRLGMATFRFAAGLGNERDGLELKLPVILPRITEAVALYGNTDGSAVEHLKIPSDIYPEAGGLRLEAASTALLGLRDGIEYLQEYPYECLEQKISRVLPFVLASDLLEAFGLSALKGKEKKEVVENLLRDLPKFQNADGGFTYWPGSSIPSEYMTAYVLFFLRAAKKDGFDADMNVVNKATGFLQRILRLKEGDPWNYPYNRNARLATEAFIVYALSLWNVREPAYITRLFEDRFRIPLFGRTMLLKAVRHSGMSKRMEAELVRDLFNSVKVDATRAHFEEQDPGGLDWIFYSPVRTTAYVLQAMLESGQSFPQEAKVIRWLMDERKNGRWRSTQENLYVFYALTEYFRRYESERPDFTAVIKLEGKEALRHLFAGRSVDAEKKTVPWSELPLGREIPAQMSKEGTGRLYYGIRMVYAPKGELPAREEGLQVTREITLANGDPLPKIVQAGTKLLVKLTVTTPFDRTYIAVEDPLPAGFQVIHTGFKTASAEDGANLAAAGRPDGRWWGSFNHREFYDDRVVLYADYMTQGSHTARYLVTTVTPGDFSLPAAKAEGMYTPEVFGRTKEGRFDIR